MRNLLSSHIPEDALESYAIGRLSEEVAAPLEEHLLVCHQCQNRLAETDQYIRALRRAAGELPEHKRRHRFSFFTDLFGWKPAAVGLAVISLAIVAFVASLDRPALVEYRDANLRSWRGPDLSGEAVVAPAGEPLRLILDAEGLEPQPAYAVDIVSAGGRIVRRTEGKSGEAGLVAKIDRRLPAGDYWVRVHSSGRERLLREFPLHLR